MKTILVTGSAGFIGSALSLQLLENGNKVLGIDNLNNYYDISLKKARLDRHKDHPNYKHFKVDIENQSSIVKIFKENNIDIVINLAAQAGVRYSIENPHKYITTNILGFVNILEECKNNKIEHLIYASSSSVYGLNKEIPFSTAKMTNHPISVYASSKKSNELLAHTYSHLYDLPTTGLRFFTVYGPWDRPDMALQQFANAIINNNTIKLFNYGKNKRDFTFIDDIVDGIMKVMGKPAEPNKNWDPTDPNASSSSAPYRIYNIGNNSMIDINTYINLLEKELGKSTDKDLYPMQPGDVECTHADVDDLIDSFNYKPLTSVETGVKEFAKWYKSYYLK
tara:strand:- start:4052 stop:5062 length:1011 start_codon:yes stop_codon:yes gene_type:complete